MLALLKVRVEAFTRIHHHQSDSVLFPVLIVPLAEDPLAMRPPPDRHSPSLLHLRDTAAARLCVDASRVSSNTATQMWLLL